VNLQLAGVFHLLVGGAEILAVVLVGGAGGFQTPTLKDEDVLVWFCDCKVIKS